MAIAPFIGPRRASVLLAVLAVTIDDDDNSRQQQFVRPRLVW
ncbi:hypothetical protein PC110_g16585 [Phytophthora cactorum]|uniref:Uncharacterized protein n=1 Tax=Phytophthora cactorum TaxID=29920 RepID=A0A329RQJ1_9STRA|nr:hypothetical protein PC110_g16585 [Phytophthora cactorum]